MRHVASLFFLTLILLLANNPSWAQFDMRNSSNPYMGMGRTGWALQERDRQLDERRRLAKSKEGTVKQQGQQVQQKQPSKQQGQQKQAAKQQPKRK